MYFKWQITKSRAKYFEDQDKKNCHMAAEFSIEFTVVQVSKWINEWINRYLLWMII